MHPAQEHIQLLCPIPVIPGYQFYLSQELLEEKLASYGITKKDAAGKYALSKKYLRKLHTYSGPSSDGRQHLKPLMGYLLEWPQQLAWAEFVERVNAFAREWLGCYLANESIETAARLLACLHLKPRLFKDRSHVLQLCLLNVLSDVTAMYERHRYHFLITHDVRTTLPNARLLHDQLSKEISRYPDASLGLLFISFNSKSGLGHISHPNPWLLEQAVSILQTALDAGYQLYQLTFSEFAILAPRLPDKIKLPLVAAKIQRAFEQVLHHDKRPYALMPTIAWTCHEEQNNIAAEALYWQAHLTLLDALQTGKRQSAYIPETADRINETRELEKRVIEAFENDEFVLYLQPIVNTTGTGPLVAEALLRWPSSGSSHEIQPTFLVNVLYEQGFGKRYCRWLINSVLRMSRELASELQQPVRLSLNLCAEDLLDQELPHLVQQSLSLWQVPAQEITMEITENGILLDEEMAYKVLQELSALGCKLALDDFGTGYSSMSRLRNLPIDIVKIDQSFVRTIAYSVQDAEIVRSIIVLAQGLGKEIVAEGIEDEESRDTLLAMECPVMQGYLYSRPVPLQEYVHWARQYPSLI